MKHTIFVDDIDDDENDDNDNGNGIGKDSQK